MKNYRNWVKDEGKKFIERAAPAFEKDTRPFGGGTEEADFSSWIDEHDELVGHAREVGKDWGLGEINFVNGNSPNKEDKAVSRDQAIDAFVRDLSRVVKQLWKKRPGA